MRRRRCRWAMPAPPGSICRTPAAAAAAGDSERGMRRRAGDKPAAAATTHSTQAKVAGLGLQ